MTGVVRMRSEALQQEEPIAYMVMGLEEAGILGAQQDLKCWVIEQMTGCDCIRLRLGKAMTELYKESEMW